MRTSETTLREMYDISNKEVKEKMELEFPTLFKKSSILNEAISYLTKKNKKSLTKKHLILWKTKYIIQSLVKKAVTQEL